MECKIIRNMDPPVHRRRKGKLLDKVREMKAGDCLIVPRENLANMRSALEYRLRVEFLQDELKVVQDGGYDDDNGALYLVKRTNPGRAQPLKRHRKDQKPAAQAV